MAANLDPRILQALFGQQGTFNANGQTQEYIDPTTGLPYTLLRNYAQGSGDAGTVDRSTLMPGEIVSPAGRRNEFGYDVNNVYDQQGNFLREDDDGAGFGAFGDFVGDNMGAILAAIATAGVASAAGAGAGAAGGAAAPGAGGWADWAASELAGAAANPATAAQLNAWAAGSALPYAGSAGVGGAAAGGAGGAGGGSSIGGGGSSAMDFDPNGITDPNFGKNASFGGTTSVGGLDGPIPANTGSRGNGWLNLLGAAAGAASSRDQTQTQSRDPWGPAQGWLKDLIGQGQTIGNQALQNPVGPRLGQAYNNLFGTVDAANANAGGWLDSMRANASGTNGYDRSNPRARRQNTTATAKPNLGWLAALGG